MNRRGFLKSIIAAGVAPYVVTAAGVLMPVRNVWTPRNPLFNGHLGFYEGLQWRPDELARMSRGWHRAAQIGLILPVR